MQDNQFAPHRREIVPVTVSIVDDCDLARKLGQQLDNIPG